MISLLYDFNIKFSFKQLNKDEGIYYELKLGGKQECVNHKAKVVQSKGWLSAIVGI